MPDNSCYRAYSIKHSYDVTEFLDAYKVILQRAIDEIWDNIRWVERCDGRGGSKSG